MTGCARACATKINDEGFGAKSASQRVRARGMVRLKRESGYVSTTLAKIVFVSSTICIKSLHLPHKEINLRYKTKGMSNLYFILRKSTWKAYTLNPYGRTKHIASCVIKLTFDVIARMYVFFVSHRLLKTMPVLSSGP